MDACGWLHALARDWAQTSATTSPRSACARRCATAIGKLNPALPLAAIEVRIEQVLRADSPSLVENHQDFHELLLAGAIVDFSEDGEQVTKLVQLVDWENPGQNDFRVVNQFTIISHRPNTRVPTVGRTCCCSSTGIPLGQIELKNPGNAQATAEAAVTQVRALHRRRSPRCIASSSSSGSRT